MIHVLEGLSPGAHPMLERAFELRYRVCVDERGWSLPVREDKREVDQFDGPQAIYLLALDRGNVAGHVRLLPTTSPHLLSTIHRHICEIEYPCGPHVWEWTRYCIEPNYRGGAAFGRVASEMMIGAVEWGLDHGVRDAVLEFDPVWITRFSELGFDVRPLGLPVDFDGEITIAVHLRYDRRALNRLRKARGIDTPVLFYESQVAVGTA